MAGKITYQATRNIASGLGHTLNSFYDLDFAMDVLDESIEEIKNTQKSLGGASETLYTRDEIKWVVRANYILTADLPLWKEFFSSVKVSESFTFYPDGVTPYTCISTGQGYKPVRNGTTERDWAFQMTIEVEV